MGVLHLLLLVSSALAADILYCDRVYQLPNRTDESEAHCRWSVGPTQRKELLGSLETCKEGTPEEGLLCGQECVSYNEWCTKGTKVPRECGALLQDPTVCRNSTLWENRQCPEQDTSRCRQWWAGECAASSDCDSPERPNSPDWTDSCLDGAEVKNITASEKDCSDARDGSCHCVDDLTGKVKLCAHKCDRIDDGCQGRKDEDCSPPSHTWTGIGVVLVIIVVIILLIESILYKWGDQHAKEVEMWKGTAARNLWRDLGGEEEEAARLTPEKDIIENLRELLAILSDEENWDLGVRDEKSLCAPTYHWGGLLTAKAEEAKKMYRAIRSNVRKNLTPSKEIPSGELDLQFLVYWIKQNAWDITEREPRYKAETLRHHQAALLYNVLEPDWLQSAGGTSDDGTKNINRSVDISLKDDMTVRDGPYADNEVYPYFDVVRALQNNKFFRSDGKLNRFILLIGELDEKIPEVIKYTFVVAMATFGWYKDCVLDILIALDLQFLFDNTPGGGWDFKSMMVIILFITALLSQTIVGLRVLLYGPMRLLGPEMEDASKVRRVALYVIFIVLCPLAPAIILYLMARRGRNVRKEEKRLLNMFSEWREKIKSGDLTKDDIGKAMASFKVREVQYREKEELRRILVLSHRLDNVLEHSPQSLIKILFILVSLSSTAVPAVRGVEAIWNSLDDDASWYDDFLFHLSTFLSAFGLFTGLYSVHMYSKHSTVPDLGKVLLLLLYIVSGGARVLCLILLAAPYLGLFGLMRPLTTALRISFDPSAEIPSELVESMKNNDWYTGVDANLMGMLLLLAPLLHCLLVFLLSASTVEDFLSLPDYERSEDMEGRKTMTSWRELDWQGRFRLLNLRLIHCLTTALVPWVFRDWDSESQNITFAEKNFNLERWKQVRREYLGQTCIFCFENLMMLAPLIHTCATVIYVYSTIPILPEERWCFVTCCILLASPLLIILLAALQHFLFRKFNTSGHTWAKLLSSRRVFHVGVRLTGSSGWKIGEVEQRLREVWQDPEDPKDKQAKVKSIRVERLVDWGQAEKDKQDLWKVIATVCPEIDFPMFESMAKANEGDGVKVEKLVREELRSGAGEEEEEKTPDSRNCMCSCNPQVVRDLSTICITCVACLSIGQGQSRSLSGPGRLTSQSAPRT